jgi:hypothetical protein
MNVTPSRFPPSTNGPRKPLWATVASKRHPVKQLEKVIRALRTDLRLCSRRGTGNRTAARVSRICACRSEMDSTISTAATKAENGRRFAGRRSMWLARLNARIHRSCATEERLGSIGLRDSGQIWMAGDVVEMQYERGIGRDTRPPLPARRRFARGG